MNETPVVSKVPRGLLWAGRSITVLVSAVFIMSAVMKFIGGPDLDKGLEHMGLPASIVVPLGILELTCLAFYLFPATAVIGAILLTGYLGGAICTHVRVHDPFIVPALLGVFVWLGIYLREPRLWSLMPIRRVNK